MRHVAWIALLAVVASSSPVHAVLLYSIDVNSDELVRIDSAAGTVTAIGPIGHNFGNPQLAALGGMLYATTPPACVPATVDLVEIDPGTGAKVAQVRVKVGASDLVTSAADGLSSDGTTLLISYRTAGLCGAAHNLADLSTAGAISNVSVFPSGSADMDALAVSGGGQVIGYDGVSGSPIRADFYAVTRPSSYVLAGSHSTGTGAYSGIVFDGSGDFWAYHRTAHTVNRIDPGTGQVLQSFPITTTRTLSGLAAATGTVGVEPTTWGRAKGAYR